MHLFNFTFKPARECAFPKTAGGFVPGRQAMSPSRPLWKRFFGKNDSANSEARKNICWHWLTGSDYFIDLGKVKLFEYSPKWIEKNNSTARYANCNDRPLYDLFHFLPKISQEMPGKIYQYVNTREKRRQLREKLNMWYDSIVAGIEAGIRTPEVEIYENVDWYVLGQAHMERELEYVNECLFFHVEESIVINYDFSAPDTDNSPVWTAAAGEYAIPYITFLAEVENAVERFFEGMEKQVSDAISLKLNIVEYDREINEARNNGIVKTKEELLLGESESRRKFFHDTLDDMKSNEHGSPVSWERIHQDVDFILSLE